MYDIYVERLQIPPRDTGGVGVHLLKPP